MIDLDAIFSPKSVAVVGASTTAGKVGHDIFVNILKPATKARFTPSTQKPVQSPASEPMPPSRTFPSVPIWR